MRIGSLPLWRGASIEIAKQPYDAETPDVENKRWILNVSIAL